MPRDYKRVLAAEAARAPPRAGTLEFAELVGAASG